MRKKVLAIVFVAALLLSLAFMSLGAGAASAHSAANPNFQGDHADDPHPSPVGRNFFDPDHPGKFKGLQDLEGPGVAGITHNPNCPLHHHNAED